MEGRGCLPLLRDVDTQYRETVLRLLPAVTITQRSVVTRGLGPGLAFPGIGSSSSSSSSSGASDTRAVNNVTAVQETQCRRRVLRQTQRYQHVAVGTQ